MSKSIDEQALKKSRRADEWQENVRVVPLEDVKSLIAQAEKEARIDELKDLSKRAMARFENMHSATVTHEYIEDRLAQLRSEE